MKEIKNLSVDQLFKISESGEFIDGFGNLMTSKDLQDIQSVIARYDLVYKLINLDREEIKDFIFNHYVIERKDTELSWIYPNGEIVTKKEKKTIQDAIGSLKGINIDPKGNEKNIRKLIDLIAKNLLHQKSLTLILNLGKITLYKVLIVLIV